MLVEESYDYPSAGEVTLKMGVIQPVPNKKNTTKHKLCAGTHYKL